MSQTEPTQSQQPQWGQSPMQTQTEWQQQPPQASMYQQPAPQPPKKKSRRNLWIGIVTIVVIIAIISIAANGHGSSQPATSTTPSTSSDTQQQPTQAANQPTSQPTTATNSIETPVVVDSTWTVTVNSVKSSQGDQIFAPKSGNTYVVVDVTIKNTSASTQHVSSLLQFKLKDSTGQEYNETVTDFSKAPDGTLPANELLRGQLAYEVPASQHAFTFTFQSDLVGTDISEWTLNI